MKMLSPMVTIILAQVPCKDSLPCFVCLFVCLWFFLFEEAWSAPGWQGGLMEEEEEEHGHCCWLKDKVLGFRV